MFYCGNNACVYSLFNIAKSKCYASHLGLFSYFSFVGGVFVLAVINITLEAHVFLKQTKKKLKNP